MANALTTDQVNHIVNNTMVVLLARPDLLPDWRANLQDLLQQARSQQLEDEMLFVAAVLTLLDKPDDTLPTGTVYDNAWESLLISLSTGVAQPVGDDQDEAMDQLLKSVAEAVVAVLTQVPDHRAAVKLELEQMHATAEEAAATELAAWISDLLALLDGTPPDELGRAREDIYAAYWDAIVRSLDAGGSDASDTAGTPDDA